MHTLVCLLAFATALVANASHATSGRGRVLLITVPETTGGWPDAEQRALAELRSLGFEVTRASSTTPERTLSQAQLIPLVHRTRAIAAVRFVRTSPSSQSDESPVVVYVVDKATGKYDIRRVSPDRVDHQLSAEQAALLAAELVYSTLVAVRTRPPPARATTAPPPPELHGPATTQPSFPTWALRAAPSLGGSPGGASAYGGLLVAGTWLYGEHTGIDLQLDGSLIPGRISGSGGTARVYVLSQRAHLRLLAWPDEPTSVSLAVGGGVLTTVSHGDADAPLTDTTDSATVGLLSAAATWDARLSPSVRLSLALRGALAIPEVRVRFAGEQIGGIGRPLLDGSIGIEWFW